MAIIDNKAAHEIEREAQEYVRRNDSASLDWQHPPPAYEEAAISSQSTSTARGTNENTQSSSAGFHSSTFVPQEIPVSSSEVSEADEDTPLLSHRQWEQLTRRKRRAMRLRKCFRFSYAFLIMVCITLMVLQLGGWLNNKRQKFLPNPPSSDGNLIRDASWSIPYRLNPELWLNPNTPMMSSKANFTFSAFDELFLRSTGIGSGFGGEVIISGSDYLSEKEWEEATGGSLQDVTLVQVEVRFTDVDIRDSIRVGQMLQSGNRGGVGIYGNPDHHRRYEMISFYVFVMLPPRKRRSPAGLHPDGSSFIPEIDIQVDNMRLGIESLHVEKPSLGIEGSITLGRFKVAILNAGVEMVSGLKANESVSIGLQNGHVRDLPLPHLYTIHCPNIDIRTVNGPLVLNKLIAEEEISLKTGYGLINITDIAISKSISVKHSAGTTGGKFRAEKLDIDSEANTLKIAVDLRYNLFEGEESIAHNLEQACQKRTVDIRNTNGDIALQYQNQNPNVQLHSNVMTSTGHVVVYHGDNFEGSFDARTNVGSIDIRQSQLEDWEKQDLEESLQINKQESKNLVIVADGRNRISKKYVKGKIWFSNHGWTGHDYCHSQSNIFSRYGTVSLSF